MSIPLGPAVRNSTPAPGQLIGWFRSILRHARQVLGPRALALAAAASVVAVLSSLMSLAAILLLAENGAGHTFTAFLMAIGTAGWLSAGVMVVVLFGRASVDHHHQWVEARKARDLLRETLEVLPAGVVVYDPDERLVMFNSVAGSVTPALQQSNPIGQTYEEVARYSARVMEEAGRGPQPWQQWIENFRTKNRRRVQQCHDGRWIEWNEKATPSGYTVGFRVDVSELKLSQLELESARGEYQWLVDSLADMVYVLDAKGVFTFASAAAERLLGMPAGSLIGTKFADLLVPEDLARATAAARRHLKSSDGGVREINLRFKRSDGFIRHMECRWRAPRNGVRREAAAVGVMRDVTDRVELAERLRRQMEAVEHARADYQSLVDSLSDVVLKIDADTGRIIFVSAAATDTLGLAPASLVGVRAYDQIVTEDRDRVMEAAQRGLRWPNEGAVQLRYRVYTPTGPRHVEARFRKTTRGPDGRRLVVGVLRDIEERVGLERRLAEETARLRSVVESSGALIVLADRDLNVAMVNSGFTGLTGISADEAIGRPLRDVLEYPVDCRFDQLQQFAVKLAAPHGARLVSVTATPVIDAEGQMSSIVLLGVDDTERRTAEVALHDAERFATVGEMAATMAHEISQPLQVINLACESARDELAEGRVDAGFQKAKLDRIAHQVETASRMVGELRAFVRGAGTPEGLGPFDPEGAVRNAIELTAHGLRQAGIALRFEAAKPLAAVRGHPGRLEQVLVNLINNARDAGGRTIDISARLVEQDGQGLIRIAVEDTGPGIPADVMPRLFVSFVTTKAKGKGTGLGLRICRRIVEEMGGTISAANRAEGGARFEILLPVA